MAQGKHEAQEFLPTPLLLQMTDLPPVDLRLAPGRRLKPPNGALVGRLPERGEIGFGVASRLAPALQVPMEGDRVPDSRRPSLLQIRHERIPLARPRRSGAGRVRSVEGLADRVPAEARQPMNLREGEAFLLQFPNFFHVSPS